TDINIILGVCAGLVIVETNTLIIRIVHFTTQEYLDSRFTQGHTDITRLLLTYLAFNNLETPHEALDLSRARGLYDLGRAPLIAYAGHFLNHAELARQDMETDANSLRELIMMFLERPHHCTPLRWYARKVDGRNPWFFRGWPTSASALWVAASANLLEIATYLVAQGASPNGSGFEYVSALGVASYYGHIDMVRLLLTAGARSNAAGVDPLQLACARHHVEIVRILIEKKFDVNAASGWYPSPLESVAPTGLSWRIGHPEIEQLLRDAGAHRCETGRKGLQIASENGQGEMVSYLLKDGERDKDGTALEAAARRGHIDVVKMILDKVADLEAVRRSRRFKTALEAASREGHTNIDHLDTDSVNHYSSELTEALEAAARRGHIDVVKMLLDKVADPEAVRRSRRLKTALEAASREGHTNMVKMLLDHLDTDSINHYSSELTEALEAASRGGHIDMARVLLAKVADLDPVHSSRGFWAALEAVSRQDEFDMAKLLLDKGAKLDADGHALTAVLDAVLKGGHIDMAEMLLNEGANLDSVDRYAIVAAFTTRGHINMAKMLLDQVADLDPVSSSQACGPALEAASREGYNDIVKMLLDSLVADSVKHYSGALMAALGAASTRGHINIVRIILNYFTDQDTLEHHRDALTAELEATSRGGNVNITKLLLDKGVRPDGRALRAAVGHGHSAIVDLLLEQGAEVNDFSLAQSFNVAIKGGFVDIVDFLLQAGANPNADVEYWHDTGLEVAVNTGNKYIVQMLLDHGAEQSPFVLILAARQGNVEIVQLLLQKVIEIYGTTISHFGWALKAARGGGHEAVVDLLQRYG
ncbi:ankyrin repeat-containing domain protein, partial [Mycena olivaceomarginata]